MVTAQIHSQAASPPFSPSSTLKCKIKVCVVVGGFSTTNVHLEDLSLAVAFGDVLCIFNGLSIPIREGVTFSQPKFSQNLQTNQIGHPCVQSRWLSPIFRAPLSQTLWPINQHSPTKHLPATPRVAPGMPQQREWPGGLHRKNSLNDF